MPAANATPTAPRRSRIDVKSLRALAGRMWRAPPAPPVKLGFFAMGTQVSITLSAGARRARRDEAVRAIATIEALMQDLGRRWWAWGDGALASINAQLAAGRIAAIPLSMRPLFARAWAMHQASGGRFDPRVAQLVKLWGFHDMAGLAREPPPAERIESALQALRSAPGYDGGGSYGPAPGIGWDFGGIGKGWIVDLALERLRELGFADAVVDAGGNLAVRGTRSDRPWRIGIRNPRAGLDADGSATTEQPGLLASMLAGDEAVNTHGDDQRFFEHAGCRYSHILHPLTGWPAQGLRSLTVVHPDGTLAEAGGAALYVAGRDGWRRLSRSLALDQVLVVTAEGEVQATPALAARLEAEPGVVVKIID